MHHGNMRRCRRGAVADSGPSIPQAEQLRHQTLLALLRSRLGFHGPQVAAERHPCRRLAIRCKAGCRLRHNLVPNAAVGGQADVGRAAERILESAEVAQVRRADDLQPSCQQSTEAQSACNSLYYCSGSRTSKGMCTGKEPPVSCTVHQLQLDRPAGAQWRFIHGGLHGCLSDASRARNALGRCKRRLRSDNQLKRCCAAQMMPRLTHAGATRPATS